MTPATITSDPNAIQTFWFGDGLDIGWPSASRGDLWLSSGPKLQQQMIARFCRFPYRNSVPGRPSTALEQDVLSHGPRFGQ